MTQEKRQINHLLSLLHREHAAAVGPGIDYGWCSYVDRQSGNIRIGQAVIERAPAHAAIRTFEHAADNLSSLPDA